MTSNLAMLERVARKLEKLNDEVVYLGGCTTALFITDPLSLDVRSTVDVDCIIDVISFIDIKGISNDKNTIKLLQIYFSFPEVAFCQLQQAGAGIHASVLERLAQYFKKKSEHVVKKT